MSLSEILMTDTSDPLYYIGADRGTHWIPVHTTACATFEEAEKVLALVRDGDPDGGPYAIIRRYAEAAPDAT